MFACTDPYVQDILREHLPLLLIGKEHRQMRIGRDLVSWTGLPPWGGPDLEFQFRRLRSAWMG